MEELTAAVLALTTEVTALRAEVRALRRQGEKVISDMAFDARATEHLARLPPFTAA